MGETSPAAASTNRWRARPLLSWMLRCAILLVPLAAGVSVATAFSRAVPHPQGSGELAWWAILFLCSGGTVWALDRLSRRLLPLTILLKLTLLFPDRAPSRFAVARRAGSPRKLQAQVRLAREAGARHDPSTAAEMVLSLVAALGAHDRKTRGHSERVRVLTDLLANAMRIPQRARDRLRWTALLHDIGKLEVSADILNKAEEPDGHEWGTLKAHPAAGARLVGPLLPWLGEWGPAIEQHHEHFDGTGYPQGLSGKEISRGARILAVTDSFETMTAPRSYKKPLSVTMARQELIRCAGTQFDPAVVRSFLTVSLGRLWWQVGPIAWLAQLPFLSLRTAGGTVAGTARSGVSAVAKTAVGLVAVGASGFATGPAFVIQNVPQLAALADDGEREGANGPASSDAGTDERPAGDDAVPDGSGGAGPANETPGGSGDASGGSRGGQETDGGAGYGENPGGGSGSSGGGAGGPDPSDSNGGGGRAGSGGGLTDATDDAVDALDATVDGAAEAADDLTQGAEQAVQDVAGSTNQAIDDLTGTVDPAADDLTDTPGGTLNGLVG